jgi:hypothetical protein
MVERFIALVEAGRWGPRDPRSMLPHWPVMAGLDPAIHRK